MLAALSAQVVLRYVFNVTLSWSEELSLALFTWIVLLMAALGVREGFHVRMDLLADPAPARQARAICARQAIHSRHVAAGRFPRLVRAGAILPIRAASTSAAIGYPIELLHASALVCGFLITLFALEAMLEGRMPADETQGRVSVSDTAWILSRRLRACCCSPACPSRSRLSAHRGGSCWSPTSNRMLLAQTLIAGTQSFSLLAIPFFMLAGEIMSAGGLSQRLINVADVLVRHLPGGMGHVTVIVGAAFSPRFPARRRRRRRRSVRS